ncbi:hypothetical protein AAZX31_01G082100 [Glycine max]|uniref:Uncharacterized protein n=1 Tax=Glycine max TaxID=3847 RepID=K7K2S8_SOYBN|nr:uncharacterized protein LOC100803220 isoform X2 [Glycine max]XP_028234220.1 uncharacterized protein LOC114414042 isoform X2 [Glycine soja]KAH1162283.1 hypothetical protein GYH30_000960 [Glycine max]KRH75516.1 hypothetical protein GLYMA_01G089500v4 [Glycine max]|eukprot:XP_014629715.1 uncharacterized protein LOC100803220 isoform X2 [Glycine max]
MWSATSSPSIFLPHSLLRPLPRRRPLCASLSWASPDPSDGLGGWALLDAPAQPDNNKVAAFPSYAVVGFGTSLALVLAVFAASRKGFSFRFPRPMWGAVETRRDQNDAPEFDVSSGSKSTLSEADPESNVTVTQADKSAVEKPERVVIPVSVDSTQEEALSVLKSLKIIEDDVEANELCTRREFARWLVKSNSSLERSPKHMIAPIVSLSGSVVTAFDDVGIDDPDFRSIQVLAEAGVIPSKLSWNNSFNYGGSDSQENINFYPDRFISRQDLIDWRAQLEYDFFSGVVDEISIKKAGYMDVKEITSPAVYVDMLAGDTSILRKVFGQSKRFQPNKPSTKAQAAVALTSGRMKEAISAELSRIEAENSARLAEAGEIWSELLSRGEIQRFWDEKLIEEKNRGFDVERLYHVEVKNLEEEEINQDKISAEYLKEKATMDCQKQLLLNLKKEVDEISEKVASERVTYVDERDVVQKLHEDLEFKHEELLNTKSTLEAEKEALQILRSWVEDEARRSQARAAVLEEVGRRWKWDDQA